MPRIKPARLRLERRPDERPQELLETALRIFATRGYHNTRLEDIAAEVGVSKDAIYHYFDPKEQLLLRAVDQYPVPGARVRPDPGGAPRPRNEHGPSR